MWVEMQLSDIAVSCCCCLASSQGKRRKVRMTGLS